MWMTDYINEINRQFRDVYGFKPQLGSTRREPLTNPPDGEYPMTIDGKIDYVRIVNGGINCCNSRKSRSKRIERFEPKCRKPIKTRR